MKNFMFRSRFGALGFAAFVIVGALVVVGDEDSPGALVETGSDIARQKAELDAQIERENLAATGAEESEDESDWDDDYDDIEYLDDDELIDDAEGIDPVPMIDPSTPDIEHDDDEVILVDDDR